MLVPLMDQIPLGFLSEIIYVIGDQENKEAEKATSRTDPPLGRVIPYASGHAETAIASNVGHAQLHQLGQLCQAQKVDDRKEKENETKRSAK